MLRRLANRRRPILNNLEKQLFTMNGTFPGRYRRAAADAQCEVTDLVASLKKRHARTALFLNVFF